MAYKKIPDYEDIIDINNIDYYDKRELKKIKRKLMY